MQLTWGARGDTLYFNYWSGARNDSGGAQKRREEMNDFFKTFDSLRRSGRPVGFIGGPNVSRPSVIGAVVRHHNNQWLGPVPVDTPANFGGSPFSRNGRRFAYVDRTERYRLFAYGSTGKRDVSRVAVAPGLASDRFFDFSPDGKLGAFVRQVGSSREVYVDSIGGGQAHPVSVPAAASIHSVRWSPDGSRIAFIIDGDTISTIGLFDSITGETKEFTSKLPTLARELPLVVGAAALAWSPDGSKVYFGASPITFGRLRRIGGIGMLDLRSGRDSLIDDGGGPVPIVSPDGAALAFQGDSANKLIRVSLRTGRRDTTRLPFHMTVLRWERSGYFLAASAVGGVTKLWRLSLGSDRVSPVGTIPSVCLMIGCVGRTF
jgi:dipeptidyl aminopeptidase/acylaminoacyl peptidase